MPPMHFIETTHPSERSLGRFISNEMGARGRKAMKLHIDACPACRHRTTHLREMARRFRDLERTAIAHAASERRPASGR